MCLGVVSESLVLKLGEVGGAGGGFVAFGELFACDHVHVLGMQGAVLRCPR